jgi:hypothetical protein
MGYILWARLLLVAKNTQMYDLGVQPFVIEARAGRHSGHMENLV